jgi:hypothetical protein
MEQLKERPPLVMFEVRQEENRQLSIERGCYVADDVDYAIITPPGSKDKIERKYHDWVAHLADEVNRERFRPDWLQLIRQNFAAWKEGQELPVSGTPIINWPGLSPAQLKNCQSLGLRAVEDVAAMNEETIGRLGMGGRALKQRATDWLATRADSGIAAEQMSALREDNARLKEQNEALMKSVKELMDQVKTLTPKSTKL